MTPDSIIIIITDEVKYAKRFEVNRSNAVYPDDGSKSGNGYAANGNGKLGIEPVEVEDEKDKQLTVGVVELVSYLCVCVGGGGGQW